MKAQTIVLILFATLFLSLASVSAAANFTAVSPAALTSLANSTTFTITALANVTITIPSTVSFSNITASISPSGTLAINTSATNTITLTATSIPSNLALGAYSGSFIIANGTDNQTIAVSFIKTYCSNIDRANVDIDEIEFNVDSGFGDDEEYWYPLDNVEVSFNVQNSGAWDISNIEIKACLYDNNAKECVMDEGDMDISEDDFDLDNGDDLDVVLTFQIDPDALEAGNKDYDFYIKAEGKIDDTDAGTSDDLLSCTSANQEIEVRTDEEFVTLDSIELPESVTCGSTFEVNMDVWNIGNKNLDQDEVFILAYSKELIIDQVIPLIDDLDKMDRQALSFQLIIPTNLTAKTTPYTIEFSVYNDDSTFSSDIYETAEDDDASFTASLKVDSCQATGNSVSITADFSSETPKAVIGSQTIIEAVIKNTGTSTATYTIETSGVSEWATATVDPKSVILNAGESKKVSVYLDINKNAAVNEKEFTIKATSGSTVIEYQVKGIQLEKGLSSSAIIQHIKDNWFIYAIVLINVILIIAIIVAVKSLVRK